MNRRRILDRIRRRRNRGGAEGGGAHLSSTDTARILADLNTIADHQIALEDRARLTGKPLSPHVETLLTTLVNLRHHLRPILAARGEEHVELNRPGGSDRVGKKRNLAQRTGQAMQ